MMTRFRRDSQLHLYPITEVVLVSLLTAAISEPAYFLRVPMSELVVNLFRECSEIETDFHGLCNFDSLPILILSLIYASILKLFFTIITFGIKVPAGIFIPSLAIGACLGRAVGILVETFYLQYPSLWIFESCPKTSLGCVTPGTYAIIGAAASLAGVTRMTVSLVVIIFELTGALSYILPVMIVVLIAKWIADSIEKESIYDALIHLNGYPHLKPEVKSFNHHASDIMTPTHLLTTISSDSETVGSLKLLAEQSFKGFPVVNGELNLIGFISRQEITKLLLRQIPNDTRIYFEQDISDTFSLDFQQSMDKTSMMVHPKLRMEVVVELFRKMGLRYMLVTRNGILLGLITKKDVLRRFA
jgi:chloride channel 3/4/5